jgi:hypothetical protein
VTTGRPRRDPDRRTARPRRRRTDLAEDVAAWMLISAAVFLLLVAVQAGVAVHASAVQRGIATAAVPVEAVLTADAPVVTGAGTAAALLRAPATWTGNDGLPGSGVVPAGSGARAGTTVTIWLDRDGRLVPHPVDPVVEGWVSAVDLLLLGGAVLGGSWIGVRRLTGWINSARWEREWADVGPDWSSTAR